MEQAKIDEIISKVAKLHGVALDRNDPIFAIITANEVMFEDFVARIENSFVGHMREIEGMTAKYIADAKQLAEVHIGAAVEETYKVLEKRHELALEQINAASQSAIEALTAAQSQSKISNLVIAGVAIASILIGFFVGKLF